MASGSSTWEELRRQARLLENEIDVKLISISKLDASSSASSAAPSALPKHPQDTNGESAPLLSNDALLDTMCSETEELLGRLSSTTGKLSELATIPSSAGGNAGPPSAAVTHTVQRHREILHDYAQEFQRTKARLQAKRQRQLLLGSATGPPIAGGADSLNRRSDLFFKEAEHMRSSERLVDEQIQVAVETRDALMMQRQTFKRFQSRLNDVASRFPMLNSLLQRIGLRKRRDALVVGVVAGICLALLILYAIH